MRQRRWRQMVTAELDLLPLMNIFIVLIPLLLLSAVFVQVTVIRLDGLPGAVPAEAAETGEPLELTVTIAPDAYVVSGRDVTTQSIARAPDGNDAVALEQLAAFLGDVVAAHPDEKSVRIVAGARTHYDEIVDVMDVTREAGLPQVGLSGADEGGR